MDFTIKPDIIMRLPVRISFHNIIQFIEQNQTGWCYSKHFNKSVNISTKISLKPYAYTL